MGRGVFFYLESTRHCSMCTSTFAKQKTAQFFVLRVLTRTAYPLLFRCFLCSCPLLSSPLFLTFHPSCPTAVSTAITQLQTRSTTPLSHSTASEGCCGVATTDNHRHSVAPGDVICQRHRRYPPLLTPSPSQQQQKVRTKLPHRNSTRI